MQSKATTVEAYLKELPADRRAAIQAVREVILKNLDKNYQEGMGYGVIGYSVPHSIYSPGYHCDPRQPLPFAGLASQKNHMAVYMMCLYANKKEQGWFRTEWENAVKAGRAKKLDMGKSCIRFKRLEDLALDVIGEAIRRVPAEDFIAFYERMMVMNKDASARRKSVAAKKPLARKAAVGKGAAKKSKAKRRA